MRHESTPDAALLMPTSAKEPFRRDDPHFQPAKNPAADPPFLQKTAKPDRGKREPKLARTTFATSRLLDFASEKELIAQTGHDVDDWPLVIVKELVDNALDACEE